MTEHPLAAWESFYVIVGTSAAALIGMQFVVMTLADARRMARADTIGAFVAPTVAHMSAALIISALMSAPWHTLSPLPTEVMGAGVVGLFYSAIVVVRRARTQHGYTTVWQDWLWYTILPSICYVTLAASAWWINSDTEFALFLIGLSSLALLMIGVHNAWDTVTHIVVSGATADGNSST